MCLSETAESQRKKAPLWRTSLIVFSCLVSILPVALFALWHVELVIIVTVIATGIGALAFINVNPKAALFKFDNSLRSIRFKLRGPSHLQRLMTAKPPLQTRQASVLFARFDFLDLMVNVGAADAAVWIMGIFLAKSPKLAFTL